MADLFSKLPRFSFRGIELPISGRRTATFSHEDVKHKFLYQDNELVESLGAQNWTFSYEVPFREGITKGPYKSLYLKTFTQFVLACRDRSPGELIDPELGAFRAKPTQFTSELDVNMRDGTSVRVEFIHAPEIGDLDIIQGGILDLSGVKNEAGRIDDAVEVQDWEQEPPPEATVDPLAAIDGIGQQLLFQANKVSAAFDNTATKLENVEQTIDRLENPQLWPIKRSSRRLRNDVLRLKERGANPGQRIITVLTRYNQTIMSIALESGLTVQQLLELNPELARTPIVPPGVAVRRFAPAA